MRKPRSISPFGFLSLVVLTLGLATAYHLAGQPQDIRKSAAEISLDDIEINTGIESIVYGLIQYPNIYNESSLQISNPSSGVYEIVKYPDSFPCSIGTSHPNGSKCEPDRFEVRFPNNVSRIYGLGMQPAVNQVEVNDILDKNFSFGHCYAERTDGKIMDSYEDGACRQRTPMLYIPEKNIIIAYMQPDVKMVRITRDGLYGCPLGKTCIVFKKHHLYPEGRPSELVIVKGSNPQETYSNYYSYLKNIQNRFFKKPHYNTFGINWETYFELGCDPTKSEILDIASTFESNNIKLSSLTIGSGYWDSNSATGCGDISDTNSPQIDTLKVSSNFGGLSGINDLFSNLMSKDIYPLIGMRHRVQPGVTSSEENVSRVAEFFRSRGFNNNFLLSTNQSDINTRTRIYQRQSVNHNYLYHYLLNTYDDANTDTWIDLLRAGKPEDGTDGYGNFQGIKHDDMDIHDQRGYYDWLKQVDPQAIIEPPTRNLRDDLVVPIFSRYDSKFNGDVLISSDSDWFSLGTDWEEMDTLMLQRNWGMPPSSYRGYFNKFYVDLALTRVISGYVNTANHGNAVLNDINNIGYWYPPETDLTNPIKNNEVIRTFQLFTFHPASRYSTGYWRIKKTDGSDDVRKQNVMIWYMQLRERLHQYTYDQANRWHETGVPWTMQPLFFRWPNDSEVYKQYEYLHDATDINSPRDEFMFGNALLVRPVFNSSSNVKVYFPQGVWKPLISVPSTKGQEYTNGYSDYPLPNLDSTTDPLNGYPVFLKEAEILLIGDSNPAVNKLWAYVFLKDKMQSSIYEMYPKAGGKIRLQALKQDGRVYLKNLNNNQRVEMTDDSYGKGFKVVTIDSLLSPPTPTNTPTPIPTNTPIPPTNTPIPPSPTDIPPPPSPTPVPGDQDGDDDLDILDYFKLLVDFPQVSIFDFQSLISNFGTHP